MEKRRDLNEVRAMDPQDIAEICGEMNLTRAQLEALVKAGPDAADEMERMMAALGIDPEAAQTIAPSAMREMQVACATCGEKRVCRHALDEGTASALMESFCANADELRDMAKRPEFAAR